MLSTGHYNLKRDTTELNSFRLSNINFENVEYNYIVTVIFVFQDLEISTINHGKYFVEE